MTKTTHDIKIELFVEGADAEELDKLTRELKREVESINIESVNNVFADTIPEGVKAPDWTLIGQMVVTLAPTVIPSFFDLLKSWVARKPPTPVKIRVRVGKKTAQIEYDPTKTTAKDLDLLIKSLTKSLKK